MRRQPDKFKPQIADGFLIFLIEPRSRIFLLWLQGSRPGGLSRWNGQWTKKPRRAH